MNGTGFKVLLSSLEASRSSLHNWLQFWTLLVVIGVVLDVLFVVWEYRAELTEFQRGIVLPPSRPSISLLLFGLLAAALVAVGVSGELVVESKIEGVETRIRRASDEQFAQLSQDAFHAEERLTRIDSKARTVESRLDGASVALDQVGTTLRLRGPRDFLLDVRRADFIKSLRPFAGQKIELSYCGHPAAPSDANAVWQELIRLLSVNKEARIFGAGWQVNPTVWNDNCVDFGGVQLSISMSAASNVQNSARALLQELRKRDIYSEMLPSSSSNAAFLLNAFGPSSPLYMAAKDPSTIFVLVGDNPLTAYPLVKPQPIIDQNQQNK